MRKIIYYVHTSVDGYIAGPNGEFDWPVMGPELSAYSLGLHDTVDTFLYGRGVWEVMSGFWPQAESMSDDPHDVAFAPVWRAMPKVVFSRTLTGADWNTTVVWRRPGRRGRGAQGSATARTCCSAAARRWPGRWPRSA